MALEHTKARSAFDIPQPPGALVGGRERLGLIGAPGHFPDGLGVAGEDAKTAAGLDVPQPDVRGAGQDPALVRTPGNGGDVVRVTVEPAQAPAAVQIPEADRRVARPRQRASLGAIEDDLIDALRVPLERPNQVSGLDIPEL